MILRELLQEDISVFSGHASFLIRPAGKKDALRKSCLNGGKDRFYTGQCHDAASAAQRPFRAECSGTPVTRAACDAQQLSESSFMTVLEAFSHAPAGRLPP